MLHIFVANNPLVNRIMLWSDSCVPQNRNCIMSFGLQYFLNNMCGKNLKFIEQKFSEPGHSQVQDIDAAHSVIERHLKNKCIYSPIGLLEEFSQMPEGKQKFVVVEMSSEDYLDFHSGAYKMNYSVIPYAKVKHIVYEKMSNTILYRINYATDFTEVKIIMKNSKKMVASLLPQVHQLKVKGVLSDAKIKDIKAMLPNMPQKDKLFYDEIFKNPNTSINDVAEQHDESDCKMNKSGSETTNRSNNIKIGDSKTQKKQSNKPPKSYGTKKNVNKASEKFATIVPVRKSLRLLRK